MKRRRIRHMALCAIALSFGGPLAAAPPPRPASGGMVPITLPEAVFLGLRNNRDIRSDYLQRIADKFALRVAEDVFTPRVYLGGTATQQRVSGTRSAIGTLSPTVTLATPTGASFSFGWANQQTNSPGVPGSATSQFTMQFIQPLLAGGGVDFATAPLRIARINEASNKLRLKQTVITTISAIVLAYRGSIQAHEQFVIAQQALKRARDLQDVNRALLAAGRIAQVELVQSESSIAQQELQVSTAENADASARLALLALLALDPSSRIAVVDTLDAKPVTVDRDRALRVAHDSQPTYLSRRLAIEVNQINLDVARNQRLWNLSLVGSSGQNGAGTNIYQAVPNVPSTKTDYSVGLQVSIPLYDPTREQGEVNAGVALRQAELQAAQADDTLKQQVTDAVRNIDTARRQLDLAKRARELAETQEQIELLKLQVGRSSNFQVVSFQNDLQTAQNTELNSVITYQNALTQLDQVVGTTLETWKISLNDQ